MRYHRDKRDKKDKKEEVFRFGKKNRYIIMHSGICQRNGFSRWDHVFAIDSVVVLEMIRNYFSKLIHSEYLWKIIADAYEDTGLFFRS